jgi:hypothetical protein
MSSGTIKAAEAEKPDARASGGKGKPAADRFPAVAYCFRRYPITTKGGLFS